MTHLPFIFAFLLPHSMKFLKSNLCWFEHALSGCTEVNLSVQIVFSCQLLNFHSVSVWCRSLTSSILVILLSENYFYTNTIERTCVNTQISHFLWFCLSVSDLMDNILLCSRVSVFQCNKVFLTADFEEVKTTLTECKEKRFQMTSSAYVASR